MAVYYLKNSLNPNGVVVPVTVDISLIQDASDAAEDEIWVIDFDTEALDTNGNEILTHTVHTRGAISNIEEVIEKGLAYIGEHIDWGTLQPDVASPYISEYSPTQTTDVSIYSSVYFKIKDEVPSTGIDPSTITLTVNGIDVTDQLSIEDLTTMAIVRWNPIRIT